MKTIGVELPISINNFYACTIPQAGKAHCPEVNRRIAGALGKLAVGLEA